jgi:hypothetical protein
MRGGAGVSSRRRHLEGLNVEMAGAFKDGKVL